MERQSLLLSLFKVHIAYEEIKYTVTSGHLRGIRCLPATLRQIADSLDDYIRSHHPLKLVCDNFQCDKWEQCNVAQTAPDASYLHILHDGSCATLCSAVCTVDVPINYELQICPACLIAKIGSVQADAAAESHNKLITDKDITNKNLVSSAKSLIATSRKLLDVGKKVKLEGKEAIRQSKNNIANTYNKLGIGNIHIRPPNDTVEKDKDNVFPIVRTRKLNK